MPERNGLEVAETILFAHDHVQITSKEAPTNTPKVCCLGTFALYDQKNEIVKWRTKKTKEVFAYLWKNKHRAIHRDVLLLAIWPDIEQEKAIPLLHTSIYQVRNTLKNLGFTQPVLFADGKYTLNVPGLSSDVKTLEKMMSTSPDQVGEAMLYMMLRTYEGDYMDEFITKLYQAKIGAQAPIFVSFHTIPTTSDCVMEQANRFSA